MNDIFVHSSGKLYFLDREFQCALGRNGISNNKQEGDGTTPTGDYPIRKLYYRSDKLDKPKTRLPIQELTPEDAWCDDVAHEEYNKFVKLPHTGSYENLWRADDVYDIIVPIGYNDEPPVHGNGSAIFIHIARDGYPGTDGCIALNLEDFTYILGLLSENAKIHIK